VTGKEDEEILPRELLVTANMCRSLVDLAQKHINFGTIADR